MAISDFIGGIDALEENTLEYDFYCDACQSHLNPQDKFDYSAPSWKCTTCGKENNLLQKIEKEFKKL